ncbi:MAG: hypothetical protein WAV41_02560 [Microgenomates group bacterium]
MNGLDLPDELKGYKMRFIAHDRSGVGNSIGEDLLLVVAPIIEPVIIVADRVANRVAIVLGASFGKSLDQAQGIGVRNSKDVDKSGLL